MCERGNEVSIKIPDHIELRYNAPGRKRRQTVSIDECIVREIRELWRKGIKTAACCCGHFGEFPRVVLVERCSIDKMEELGYEHWENPMDTKREDGFYLKH